MSKGKSVLLALATLVSAGTMASSAFALPDISVTLPGPLTCYRISNFKVGERAGNWGNATCGVPEHAKLTVEFVLAEPVFKLAGTENLWCAKLTPYTAGTNSATGNWSNPQCTSAATDGEYVDVIVPGNGYPLHLEATVLVNSFLENTGSETLESAKSEGGSLLLLFITKELTALGTFEALFTKVHEGGKPANTCHSEGDPTGEVLTKGVFHLVETSLTNLQGGILYLVNEVKVTCSLVIVKIKGSVLSSITNTHGGSETGETSELGGRLEASSVVGVPKLTGYYNDSGTIVHAKLEANFGTGFQEAAEVVGEEVKVKALNGEMFTITGI